MTTPLVQTLGLDLRSLAAFRICLGSLLLVDIVERARNLTAHYTDAGVMPVDLLYRRFWTDGYWSFHTLDGGWAFQAGLFAVAALLAIQLIVGWKTKLASVASWVFLASLQARNPLVLQGGDDLLRLITFWAMFLPLGARWSLDARSDADDDGTPAAVLSVATVALIVQVSLMYWATAILKTGPEWIPRGVAVAMALRWETYSTPLADAMLWFPLWMLKGVTWSVLSWEILGPLLLFVPWRVGPVRTFAVASMVFMHVCFGVTLTLGLFSFTSITCWIAFLPAWFWDRLLPASRPSARVLSLSRVVSVVVAALLLYVTMWNVRTLAFKTVEVVFPRSINPVAYRLRLEQYWTMFAPSPPNTNTWWVIEGHLDDGSVVDLYAMTDTVTDDRPADMSSTYDGQRWRKFMFNLPNKRNIWPTTADWYRKRWEAAHPDRPPVRHIRMVRWNERVRPLMHDPAVRAPMVLYTVLDDGTLRKRAPADAVIDDLRPL